MNTTTEGITIVSVLYRLEGELFRIRPGETLDIASLLELEEQAHLATQNLMGKGAAIQGEHFVVVQVAVFHGRAFPRFTELIVERLR